MVKNNINQILRIDGKNVFLEVMNNAFQINKVQINFVKYDLKLEKNSRQLINISLYIDIDKILILANDILSGRLAALAKQANNIKEKSGYKYCKEIYADIGGVSAVKLKERGKERPDGKCLFRRFKITPGDKVNWIFSGEIGAGEESETGLIIPQDKPEEIVRVPLNDEDLKKFALVLKSHIQAYLTSLYIKE
ncbi:hypothetical protein [Clostridium ljungdahlii]|uniref:Uncharacterized protein n=1 Tax=Clostridium ljungdahlii TaxID=1538 RepID=A0A162L2W7_9CLOT|nr:hypothetical protein [Clostridium ljungdahlii]OAA87796.1 hypothetical protein WY13_01911 [Clostridium ljungdahlii]